MSIKLFLSITLISVFLFGGCSAHRILLDKGNSKSAIYQMDETQIFNLVYSSVQEVFPQEKISVITVPTRGYITKFLAPPFHIDWFTQKVLVHRSSGVNFKGNKVYGYWIEVSSSGSSFLQGQLKNEELFNTIMSHLENTAKKQIVTNITKSQYIVSQENFYVWGADTLVGDGFRVVITDKKDKNEPKDKAEQLRELYKLKTEGVLTQKEYESAKKKVIDRY